MALVGAILEQGRFWEALNQLGVTDKRSGYQIKDSNSINIYIACCMGRPDFEAVHEMDSTPGVLRAVSGRRASGVGSGVTPADG